MHPILRKRLHTHTLSVNIRRLALIAKRNYVWTCKAAGLLHMQSVGKVNFSARADRHCNETILKDKVLTDQAQNQKQACKWLNAAAFSFCFHSLIMTLGHLSTLPLRFLFASLTGSCITESISVAAAWQCHELHMDQRPIWQSAMQLYSSSLQPKDEQGRALSSNSSEHLDWTRSFDNPLILALISCPKQVRLQHFKLQCTYKAQPICIPVLVANKAQSCRGRS